MAQKNYIKTDGSGNIILQDVNGQNININQTAEIKKIFETAQPEYLQELYKQIDANYKEFAQQNEQKIQEIIALLQNQAKNRGITFEKSKNILTGTISDVKGNVHLGDTNIQNANLTPLYILIGFVLILVLGIIFKNDIFKGKNNIVQNIDTVQTQPQDTSNVVAENVDTLQTLPKEKPEEESKPVVIPKKLSISLTTNKGTKPVFTENDEVKIYFSVNKPAYVRIIYQMADGSAILLADNMKVDAKNINKKIKTPYDFVCAEPFGAENMVAYAQSQPFEPLQTKEQYGYLFITQSIYSAYEESEKGLRRKLEFAKNEIKVTTKN